MDDEPSSQHLFNGLHADMSNSIPQSPNEQDRSPQLHYCPLQPSSHTGTASFPRSTGVTVFPSCWWVLSKEASVTQSGLIHRVPNVTLSLVQVSTLLSLTYISKYKILLRRKKLEMVDNVYRKKKQLHRSISVDIGI